MLCLFACLWTRFPAYITVRMLHHWPFHSDFALSLMVLKMATSVCVFKELSDEFGRACSNAALNFGAFVSSV